jgi:Cytochrome c oxidase subunit IV
MQTSEESHPVAGSAADTGTIANNEESASHDGAGVHLPPSSIWPMTTAGGVALGGLGLVTTPVFSFVGLILMFAGIVYWIQELRHEPH